MRLCFLVFLSSFQMTAHSLAEIAKRQERIHAGHGITVEKCLNTGVSNCQSSRYHEREVVGNYYNMSCTCVRCADMSVFGKSASVCSIFAGMQPQM